MRQKLALALMLKSGCQDDTLGIIFECNPQHLKASCLKTMIDLKQMLDVI